MNDPRLSAKLIKEMDAEIAELSAQRDAVLDLCARAEYGARRWADPLPVPGWVDHVRAALGIVQQCQIHEEGIPEGARLPGPYGEQAVRCLCGGTPAPRHGWTGVAPVDRVVVTAPAQPDDDDGDDDGGYEVLRDYYAANPTADIHPPDYAEGSEL